MPGFHVKLWCFRRSGRTVLYESTRPRVYDAWQRDAPLSGFVSLPADHGYYRMGHYRGSDEQLRVLCGADDLDYLECNVYGNYGGGLDLYIRKGGVGEWLYYTLTMPSSYAGRRLDPTMWWQAIGKVYNYSIVAYDANGCIVSRTYESDASRYLNCL